MRACLLFLTVITVAGCAFFDPDDDPPSQDSIPEAVLTASCPELWKRYSDELQLVDDDDANWQAHDDRALQYFGHFGAACNAADMRETAARDLRCKALWGVYVKEVGRMTKEEQTWRDHDAQQTEAMNRIRSNCAKTACTFFPGIRCRVPSVPG
ncbi:MAG TPA: hypothetical protein PKA61_06575 [Nitrospira sp.]|nr:hypothetical protein [Nitrospira sp.]